MKNKKIISVIVPAYNEENRIKKTLEKLKNENVDEIVVVCDGKDKTAKISKKFDVKVLEFDERLGKGNAIKKGLEVVQGNVVVFTDADFGFQDVDINSLIKKIGKYDIVIGARNVDKIKKTHRKIVSIGLRFLIKLLLDLNVQDTQCGFKAFKKDVFEDIVGGVDSGGYSFDIELLHVAKDKYKIKEVPVDWKITKYSKVNPFSDSIDVFFNLCDIKWKQKK